MNFYQALATILLKVWAATLLLEGAMSLASVVSISLGSAYSTEEMRAYYVSQAVQIALWMGIGLAVWGFADLLARRLGKTIDAPEPALGLTPGQFMKLGIFLIGLFYIVSYGPKAIVETVHMIANYADASPENRAVGRAIGRHDLARLALDWIVFVTALLLAFRAQGLGRFFAWLREAGLSKPERVEN